MEDRGSLTLGLERDRVTECVDMPPGKLDQRVGRNDVDVRPSRDRCCNRLEPPRQKGVVLVELDNEVAGRPVRGRVHCRGNAAVLLADDLHPLSERTERSLEVVRRAVVANHDLVRLKSLVENRLQRPADRRCATIVGDDDREHWTVARLAHRRQWSARRFGSSMSDGLFRVQPAERKITKGGASLAAREPRPPDPGLLGGRGSGARPRVREPPPPPLLWWAR